MRALLVLIAFALAGAHAPPAAATQLEPSFPISLRAPDAPDIYHALCAMASPGLYYERGLLHPFIDCETPPPWLDELVDPMDEAGNIHVRERPGLGMAINFDFIRENAVNG